MQDQKIKSEQDSKLLIKLPEAALLLSMCERTLWSLAVSGSVPSFKVGRSRFFSVAALMDWIDTNLADGGAN